ncbi:hypothetical protein QAD02_018767 [Eretmocerus hayati]|uniref:Uncharacterized protein n=1 Tax=Eretmocerus hayati TaxID=131215 RepID=A0ACC2PHA6_9HYME|nr:hypothetical protein QAD02_018767 [Eretmocerus hayati]
MLNLTQEKIVIAFMIEHSEVGKGHQTSLGPNGKILYRQLLDRLLADVNCAGPPMTLEQLRNAWTARKLDAKDRMVEHRKQKKKTGNMRMTAVLTEQEEAICKLFKDFALPLFLDENFGFGLKSKLTIDDDEKEQRFLPSEKRLIIGFMEKNPTYVDGMLVYTGSEAEKKKWLEFITDMQQNGKTAKTSVKLLSCWLDALDRVATEAKQPGVKLSQDKQRMLALLKSVKKEDFSASSCKAKIKKLDNLESVSAGAMKDLQDFSLPNKSNGQSLLENKDFNQGKIMKRYSNGSCSGSDDSDCYAVPSKKLSKWSLPEFKTKSDQPSTSRSSEILSSFINDSKTLTYSDLEEKLDEGCLDLTADGLQMLPDDVQLLQFHHLRIEKNELSFLPAFLTSMVCITRIEVQENQLESLPDDIGLLLDLKHLNVSSNKLTTLPLSMALLNKLKYLNVNQNPLDESLTKIAGSCHNSSDFKRCAEMMVDHLGLMKAEKESAEIACKNTLLEIPYHDDQYVVNMGNETIEKLDVLVKIGNTLVENQVKRDAEVLSVLKEIRDDNRDFYSYFKSQRPAVPTSVLLDFSPTKEIVSGGKENESEDDELADKD